MGVGGKQGVVVEAKHETPQEEEEHQVAVGAQPSSVVGKGVHEGVFGHEDPAPSLAQQAAAQLACNLT